MVSEEDLVHLRRCVELAAEAADAGDGPFGSVLVGGDGRVLLEARNLEVTTNDPTAHPELAIARWAGVHLSPEERAAATTYTSGEHCPMCAAAHGWAGLGRIVFVHSAEQLSEWRGRPALPVTLYPAREVLPTTLVEGPLTDVGRELLDAVRALHLRRRTSPT